MCHNHGAVCRYRVDRMTEVTMTDSKIAAFTEEEKKDLDSFKSLFTMYGGERRELKLQFNNSLMDVVIDRFGDNVECMKNSDDTFVIRCEVQLSPTFWGWLFQFGTKAKVLEPYDVCKKAQMLLNDLLDMY